MLSYFLIFSFFTYSYFLILHLPPFPTRRSSDLSNIQTSLHGRDAIVDNQSDRHFSQAHPNHFSYANGKNDWDEPAKSAGRIDRKSTRLNSSHTVISYAVFCLKKKKEKQRNNIK